MPKLTPSQTIGPFFFEAMKWAIDGDHSPDIADTWQIRGQMFDGEGRTIDDAIIEVWTPDFLTNTATRTSGFQRVATDARGGYTFHVPRGQSSIAYANVTILARGLLRELFTRVYIGQASEHIESALPSMIPAHRRHTLIGRHTAAGAIGWDIHLQGENETVFFDCQ